MGMPFINKFGRQNDMPQSMAVRQRISIVQPPSEYFLSGIDDGFVDVWPLSFDRLAAWVFLFVL